MVKDGEASEWSKSFTLDAVGSEGIFSCKFKHSHQEYQVHHMICSSDICSCNIDGLHSQGLCLRYNFHSFSDITTFCPLPPSQMGSTVQLSRFALTKIITISPFYLLYNKTKVRVERERESRIMTANGEDAIILFCMSCLSLSLSSG